MENQHYSIPSVSDIRNYVFYGKFVKLLSDLNSELCKIVQENTIAELTLFDVKSCIRYPRKIATIINGKISFVK